MFIFFQVQPEFSRPYPAASQHEMQDLTSINAAEPPSYASVKDYTNDNSDINNFASDATHHNNDVMRSNRAAGAQRSMELSAPGETESNIDQNEPNNMPPPPSYDMAVLHRDIYRVSESQPTNV